MAHSLLIRFVVVMGLVGSSSVVVIATSAPAQAATDPMLPTLSMSLDPSTNVIGATSTLTFTIANTTAAPAQTDLAFTALLPSGLTPLATGPAPATTCVAAANLAVNGQQLSVDTLGIAAGDASCTVSFGVTAIDAGTYSIAPSAISTTTLNPPVDPADLIVTDPNAPVINAQLGANANAATWSCTSNTGYLFQSPRSNPMNPPHTVTAVDLATGTFTALANTKDWVNAVALNPVDGFMYGWDVTHHQLARIDANSNITLLGVPSGMTNPNGVDFNTADFDPSGNLWMSNSSNAKGGVQTPNSPWFEINVNTVHVKASGKFAVPNTISGGIADWAWINGFLYALQTPANNNGNPSRLLRFNPATGNMKDMGPVPVTAGEMGSYGAAYSTPDGNLWVSSNVSGKIYRVDVSNVANSILVANGPASDQNDGARCAAAAIPTITVVKNVVGRQDVNDQFTVGLVSAGNTLTSATTTGTQTTVSTTNWPVDPNTQYQVTDAVTAGSSSLSDYKATISCVDTATGAAVPTSGTVGSWTLRSAVVDPITCTVTNAGPAFSVTKTADKTTAQPGDVVKYTIVVTNNGGVAYTAAKPAGITDDLSAVLDDATYNGDLTATAPAFNYTAPVVSWSGPLAVGASVTLTYSVTVNNPDTGDNVLTNTVVCVGTTDPACAPPPVVVPVALFTATKKADVSQAEPGDKVTYTIVVTNTGGFAYTAATPASITDDLSAVIDDATFNNDATASDGSTVSYSAATKTLSWSGALPVKGSVTITYSVQGEQPRPGRPRADQRGGVRRPARPELHAAGGRAGAVVRRDQDGVGIGRESGRQGDVHDRRGQHRSGRVHRGRPGRHQRRSVGGAR